MTNFDKWYSENTDGLLGDEHQAYNHAKKAWNAAVDAVDNNITHRSPELDQDIWEIYVDNNE